MKINCILFILLFSFFNLNAQTVSIESFGTGFSVPIDITHAGDSRLFIVERHGTIKILNDDGTVNATAFLDINARVGSSNGEQGLLSLAFHPDYVYATGGFIFVNYTNNSGNTVISKFTVAANSSIANATSETILLTISQPFANHNGGNLEFGADGYLYIGMGDGGDGGDPGDRAQDGGTLLGKMLRIDVDSGSPYGIPADNPFVSNGSILDEIWAIGLRNPWKFSFDKNTGDLWIGDVGQGAIEEIDFTLNGVGGLNYGWRCYEGNSTYNTSGCADISTMTFPIAEYNHTSGRCSITGGYRYRGSNFPAFDGLYFFGDYCSNEIGTLNGSAITFHNTSANNISTFGEDVNGELYVAGLNDGIIYKIIDPTLSVNDYDLNTKIRMFPNPATDEIYFEILNNMQISNVIIFDSLGKQVLQKSELNLANNKIDISSITKGVYFLRIDFKDGKNQYKKLLVQ